MTTSLLFIRCRRCARTGRIETKDTKIGVDKQARREAWVRYGPNAWECPDCTDRLMDAMYDREEQNAED